VGTEGRSPQNNLRWGTAHASVHPNILRTNVIGCEAKYELTKNQSLRGISGCEIGVFGQEKEERGDHLLFYSENPQNTVND